MSTDVLEHLKSLHTAAIDARNGYDEALNDADKHGLTGLFKEIMALHQRNADELTQEIASRGGVSGNDGSFMSTIHRTIMTVRGVFGGLDESVLPGLIDGEERNVASYNEALEVAPTNTTLRDLLVTQRERISGASQAMKAMKSAQA